ncbi:MAG: LysM peptidoglycan-binding domain-containing protein [Anaerolineales bacterium]
MPYRWFIILSLVLGLMIVPTIAQAQSADPPGTTHTVQAGENLFRIALRYGFSVDALARANNINDPTRVYAGQVLVLPLAVDEVAAGQQNVAIETASADSPTPADGPTIHVVLPNQGLSSIAQAYGVSWVEIAQVNSLSNPDVIFAGQELLIPNPTRTPPADYGQPPPAIANTERYIVVDLSDQMIRAYENDQLMREVVVSTGLASTPTVQGEFAVYSKLPQQAMSGPGYYLPGVPWVMYFYRGYAIHGTYWHNNFGQPMSHGCVNLPSDEAAWFYEFAQIGTIVRVQQ